MTCLCFAVLTLIPCKSVSVPWETFISKCKKTQLVFLTFLCSPLNILFREGEDSFKNMGDMYKGRNQIICKCQHTLFYCRLLYHVTHVGTFYKLKTRPSTSKNITHFIAVVWNWAMPVQRRRLTGWMILFFFSLLRMGKTILGWHVTEKSLGCWYFYTC